MAVVIIIGTIIVLNISFIFWLNSVFVTKGIVIVEDGIKSAVLTFSMVRQISIRSIKGPESFFW